MLSHYFEMLTHYFEILCHYFEKVSHNNDLQDLFFNHIGGNGLPYIDIGIKIINMYAFVQIIASLNQFTRHKLTSTRHKWTPISINN